MFSYFGYGVNKEQEKEEQIQKTVSNINEKVKEKQIEKNKLQKKLNNLRLQIIEADNEGDQNAVENLGIEYDETEKQLNFTEDILKNITTQKYAIDRSISNKNTVETQKDVVNTLTTVNSSIKEVDVITTQTQLEEGISQTDDISKTLTSSLRKNSRSNRNTSSLATKNRLAQWKMQQVPAAPVVNYNNNNNNQDLFVEKNKITK
jgi:hypothetical protein